MRRERYSKTLVTMPKTLVERLDIIGKEVKVSRSELISDMVRYMLDHTELLEKVDLAEQIENNHYEYERMIS